MIDCVLRNDDHVLHELLSKRVHIADTLRTRCHDRTIPENKGHLAEKNFITSMLYKIYFNFNLLQILTDVPLRFDNCFLHEEMEWNNILCLRLSRLAGGTTFLTGPFVTKLVSEHDSSKTSELVLLQTVTSSPRCKARNDLLRG